MLLPAIQYGDWKTVIDQGSSTGNVIGSAPFLYSNGTMTNLGTFGTGHSGRASCS